MKILNISQLASWLTSGMILLTIAFIADIFVYIPAACLAGVVIVAAASMFKPAEWKVSFQPIFQV